MTSTTSSWAFNLPPLFAFPPSFPGSLRAMADFACSVCGAISYSANYDDEQVCNVCGTLSQLTVAESHDLADSSTAAVARAGRNIVSATRGPQVLSQILPSLRPSLRP
ncbi:hypothetical protein NGA_0694900, partial [Nannochloropsis gaditana CCMP526]|uniref:uncharacterized protein n=1 Tax=Nannochloropsis gaditana (strain CCMP526) TaxID=1093141 RepID=UPI00029F6329